MENICRFLKTEKSILICKMKGGQIDKATFESFCSQNSLTTCPTYTYYLQEYKKLTSK